MLVAHLVEHTAEKFHKRIGGCSPRALEVLAAYAWPGNVRELQNEIERAVALTPDGGVIDVADLSPRLLRPTAPAAPLPPTELPLRTARDLFEREYVAQVLARHGGNASRAAKTLGISRVMLQKKIRVYGLREKASGQQPR